MVGEARQERPARHVVNRAHVIVETAFLANQNADIREGGIVAAAGEIEQDAVCGKIGNVRRLKILD